MGGETEIDKAVSDELAAPLLHLLRNALDHGLEPPAGRLAARKPRRGRLVLCAFRRGGRVLLEVSDDGRGIDPAAVRAAAERRGLPPGAPLSAAEVLELIFRPGFSTAASVSEGSGRGVGLDAVGAALRRLKGTIEPRTIAGQGTTFTLSVPLSLALVRALIVVAGGRRFAIPLGVIRENLRLEAARLRGGAGSAEFYERPAGSLPLVRLRALFGATDGRPVASGVYAVIASAGGRDVGIVIDGFAGQQEVVVKPIGGWARELPGISGATDLGDATAVLVLDPESLPLGGARAGAAA
jgi:two-component system chemotaxis sensor kinase CheA